MQLETNYKVKLSDITIHSNNRDLEFSIFHEHTKYERLWAHNTQVCCDQVSHQ